MTSLTTTQTSNNSWPAPQTLKCLRIQEISHTAFKQYRELTLEHFPRPILLDLDSGGGSLGVALDWADHLSQYQRYGGTVLATGGRIQSAAVCIYLVADQRFYRGETYLQFHYPRMRGQHSETNRKRRDLYLRKLRKLITLHTKISDLEVDNYIRNQVCLLGSDLETLVGAHFENQSSLSKIFSRPCPR